MKCQDCKYSQPTDYKTEQGDILACCSLTNHVVYAEKEHDCLCFNKDLSPYNICYNCKFYGGGGDWGLFCSHKDKYHHLGHFNDEACEYFDGAGEAE